jgi:predicted RNA binding protein with dsRBD fold (UPF0201 family)
LAFGGGLMGVVVRARPPRGPAVACLRQVSQRRVAKFNLRFSSPVEVKEQKTQRDRSKFFRDTQSLRKKSEAHLFIFIEARVSKTSTRRFRVTGTHECLSTHLEGGKQNTYFRIDKQAAAAGSEEINTSNVISPLF